MAKINWRSRGHIQITMSILLPIALVSVLASTAVSATTTSTSSTSRSAHAKAVKPDYGFFAGKTITWVTGKVGASNDTFDRILAPRLGAYLHATVNVENISAGPTAAENTAAGASPDGLTIGTLQITSDLDNDVEHISGSAFSLQKQVSLGAVISGDGLIGVTPSFPIRTFKELVASKSIVSFVDETPGGTDLEARLLFAAYHVKAKLVTGYNSNALVTAGFQRGDAPGIVNGANTLVPLVIGNQINVLLQFGALPNGSLGSAQLKSAMTVQKYTQLYPPKTAVGRAAVKELISIIEGPNMMMIAPQGTPAPIALALTDAIHALFLQPSTKAALIAGNISPKYESPAAAEKVIHYDFIHQPVIEKELAVAP